MPSLNYPYTFQCKKCGKRMVIKRSDAQNLSDDPDSHNALKRVLKDREWVEAFNGIFCSDCAGGDAHG